MKFSQHEPGGLAAAFIERCTRRNARLIVDARGVSASWRRTSSGPE
jgi:hypothetical protein